MTQIFTGNGLGLQSSSLGLGSYGPKGIAALGQSGESVYVNAANGNLVFRQSDGFLADIGFGLDLFQTYNSLGEGNSPWSFNVQSRLEFNGNPQTSGSSITRIGEDGHRSRYLYDEKKQAYLSEEGGTTSIKLNQNGWVYREGNQKTASYYSKEGRLNEIRDQDGHSLIFTYEQNQLTSITDQSNKQKITWSFKKGLLQDVTTTSNGVITHHLHYEYDDQQRLHKVSRDLGQGKTFWITYDYAGDSNRISDIKQSDGTSLHIDYDAQGRVKKLIDGEGRSTTYDYQTGKTTITNSLGEAWTYYYDDKNRLTGVDGPEHYKIRYYYEGNNLSSIVQGTQIWKFTYNENGDCIRIEEPSGQITKRMYDAEHRLIAETTYQCFDGDHHPIKPKTTRYIYDERGHLIFTLAADGTVKEYRYDEQGQLTSSRCYLKTAYDLSAITDEELISKEKLQAWINLQNPQQVSLVDYHYDWRGQLIEEIHYNQVDSTGAGLLAGALITRTRYDASGRLVEKSTPSNGKWSVTQYIYDDLGRLIQTIDNQKNSQSIEYDDEHHRIIQTDANGLQTISIYDRSGLLLSTMRTDSKHSYGRTSYQYDAAGRLIAETGVDGLTNYIFYDHLGRIQAKVNSSGQMTEYLYNQENLLIQTHQYEESISTLGWLDKLPAFADIKPKSSSKDRISQNIYNQYQQLVYKIDAEGAVIAYQYDAQGQVTVSTAYAKRLSDFNPEQILDMDSIHLSTDNKDRSAYYYYDVQGRLEAQVNGEGFATAYHYDRQGHLTETCRYRNPLTKQYTGNWLEDKPAINSSDIRTYSLYDDRGLKIADIDSEGYLTEYRYDESGLLQERCAYNTAISTSIVINESTTIEKIRPKAHNNDHHSLYQYNDLGLLIQEKTSTGLVTTYAYDEMGRLITKTAVDEQTHATRQQRHRYDAMGRVIQSLDELGCALLNKDDLSLEQIEELWQQRSIRYTYDEAGLLCTKTNALQQTTYYFYDENKALRYTVNADGAVTETRYNHFGQVASTRQYALYLKQQVKELNTEQLSQLVESLAKENLDELTHYEYNTIGQLIAKSTGHNGQITHQYNAFGELESSSQKIDAKHNSITTFDYDKRGFLTKKTDDAKGLARQTELHYNAFGFLTEKSDGRFNKTQYTFNKRGEQITITNALNQYKTISYDAFGRVLYETDCDKHNKIKIFTYDDKNKTITLTNPDNSKILTQYNAFGDNLSIKDANGKTTTYYYDVQGQIIQIEAPEKRSKKYQYDEAGHLIWQQEAGGQITTYSYDAAGHLLTKIIDPEGLKLKTSYQYDAIGRQIQITDAKGCIKQFTYDDQGNLIQTCIDADGLNLISQFTYDDRGLLLRQTEINAQGAHKTTAYEWDNLGRRTATITDPDGLKLSTTYQYDANDNLTCQTDANNHSTHYIYDANNQCRYQINARGGVTEHVYNKNGNEIKTVVYAQPVPGLLEYNEENLKAVLSEDALHDQYQFRAYDSRGQITMTYDALGFATRYTYDGNGNVLSTTKYAKAVSLDELKQGIYPTPSNAAMRTEHFIYDDLNQLRFKSNSYGYCTEYQYNLDGQVIAQIKHANILEIKDEDAITVADALKKLISNPQQDQITRYTYDKAGRLNIELSAEGIAKSYEYDNLGQVTSSTVYATRINTQDLNQATIPLIKSSNDRSIHYIYDAAGRELYRISSEGRVLERRYDAVGNVIAELTHAKPLRLSSYTQEDIKTALKDYENQAKQTQYEYDAAGRLLTQTNALQAKTQYSYDAQGNLLSKTDANHAIWLYQYDEENQLIESTSPTTQMGSKQYATITRHEYDQFGNVIAIIRDAEGLKQKIGYEFNNNNQLIKTIYPDASINQATAKSSNQRQETKQTLSEEVTYNAFGEVTAKSDKAGNWKYFAYDDQGLMKYSLDTKRGLTGYSYDAFGHIIEKTLYATPLIENKEHDYSRKKIEDSLQLSQYDRHETYLYNLDNQLIEVSRDPVRMYNPKKNQYDSSIRPTTKTTYNAFGEVIKSATRINESDWAETYTYYDKDGHQSATINAEGYLTTYQYNVFGEVDNMTEYALAANSWTTETFNHNKTSTKDRSITYAYDALGQLTSKTLKDVRIEQRKGKTNTYETISKDLTTIYTYDALGNLTSTTDAKGNTAYCYYNELGQLIAKVAPKTQEGRAATTYGYDALGNLVETRKWANGAEEANAEQFKLKAASKDDIITSNEYNNQGQLIAEIDGLKHQVNYSYDANGNLTRSWTSLKQADKTTLIQDKRYTYDSEQHLLQTATLNTTGILHTIDAQYNTFGELIAKGVDGKYTTHVEYDTSGRVWRSNTKGYYQIFVYDLMDHITQIVTSTNNFRAEHYEKGVDLSLASFEADIKFNQDHWLYDLQRQNNTYDALGRLLIQSKESTANSKTKSNDVHLEYAKQSQTVDRWGNMLTYTNALGFQTNYEYNAFNQVIRQELPEVKVVDVQGKAQKLKPINTYAYDELGQAIAMMDANGHTVSKEYDAMGHAIIEGDAKGKEKSKHYNLLEQLTEAKNELGGITRYTYDQANRLTDVSTTQTKQHYEYDEAGQLIKQKIGDSDENSYWYDAMGNQSKRRDARGYETSYEYDGAGHKTKETDALGRSQSWTYNDQGLVKQHTDLGGHVSTYDYNSNGLLLEEQSTSGKHTKLHYQGDGELIQYVDETLNEVINYTYDALGQLTTKESGQLITTTKDGWLRETDMYQYDALGRLITVRRRGAEDTDNRFPDKDHALLSIDYDYDAVGNIRHTEVSANYTGYEKVRSDDYYLYDENNRMTVNKGQLVNDQIKMTTNQGSTLTYDDAGHITHAEKYENNAIQKYDYLYNNNDNQLELIKKNGKKIQAKYYDTAGRIREEDSFDENSNISQYNIMSYDKGELTAQSMRNSKGEEVALTTYDYDAAGNMRELKLRMRSQSGKNGYTITHNYQYAGWDSYLQTTDTATQVLDQGGSSTGTNRRLYNVNGQLKDAEDEKGSNSAHYWNSSLEGTRARADKDGQTNYLSVAGKTIGDLQLDKSGKQHLNVYGGFTPTGSQQKSESNQQFENYGVKAVDNPFTKKRAAGDIADGTLPEAPQDNLGAYTLQAGDTLESVALQVYGDSSLWYLLADANGVTDRNAKAGSGSQLQIGQRLNIPQVATSQHQTNATHKILNSNQKIGNISASTITPTPPPPPRKNSIFAKIAVAVVAIVATVLSAGVLGALAGASLAGGVGGLFAAGTAVLGATSSLGITATLGVAFSAGFLGNIASQSLASALNLQEGVNFGSALISGLATAASAGLLRGLNNATAYNNFMGSLQKAIPSDLISKNFNIASAAQLMEQDALSQGINLALRKHQHFDWEELAIAGVTAGFMGSETGGKLDKKLKSLDHNTKILSNELTALTKTATQALTGTHLNAIDVLTENLGSTLGNAIIEKTTENHQTTQPQEIEEGAYCPIPTEEGAYSPLPPGTYKRFHKEAAEHRRAARELELEHEKEIGTYESLTYDSDLFKSKEATSFEDKTYWGKTHPISNIDSTGLTLDANQDRIIYQYSEYTFNEALDSQMNIKGNGNPKYWTGGKTLWSNASRKQVSQAMDVDKLFTDPVQKMQFLDLRYQDGITAEDLNGLLEGKGVLSGKGDVFLDAAEKNNLNPVYLVAHALHESNNGVGELSKANNFFGLGALDGNAIKKGTKFAKEHGWLTPDLGIMGGAKIISATWVNRTLGTQHTLYAMRWNPMHPGKNPQYATDIKWANQQTARIYKQVTNMQKINSSYHPLYIVPRYAY